MSGIASACGLSRRDRRKEQRDFGAGRKAGVRIVDHPAVHRNPAVDDERLQTVRDKARAARGQESVEARARRLRLDPEGELL